MKDRIFQAVWEELRYVHDEGDLLPDYIPITAALVTRAEVGVCPECRSIERRRHLEQTQTGMLAGAYHEVPCGNTFHDAHEAYEQAKKEAGLT